MKIIACCKIVPNEEEITVLPDRTLAMADASLKISQYDLNALESGKKLAAESGGTMTALSIGSSAYLENSKIRKDILSRGADELSLVMDDSHDFSDSLQTAKAIAGAVKAMDSYDVVLCGAGSSDLYLQEVGIQAGTLLGVPVVNNVTGIKIASDSSLEVERTLEEELNCHNEYPPLLKILLFSGMKQVRLRLLRCRLPQFPDGVPAALVRFQKKARRKIMPKLLQNW